MCVADVTFFDTETAVESRYRFDADSGLLMSLHNSADNSFLTFEYSASGKLETVRSSEGYYMNVQYNVANLVKTVTLFAQETPVTSSTYV